MKLLLCRSTHRPPADQGLSLLELVVALALFALVAVMGVQALHVTLSHRDRLLSHHSDSMALAQTLALLRQDLAAAQPRLFFPIGTAAPLGAMVATGSGSGSAAGFDLSIGAHLRLDPATGQEHLGAARVIWRLNPDLMRLERQVWTALVPQSPDQLSAVQPLLDGVQDLSLRSYWDGVGWVPGLRAPQGVQPGGSQTASSGQDSLVTLVDLHSDQLPVAVELTLVQPGGDITLIEVLR